jgi:hypothetical protein
LRTGGLGREQRFELYFSNAKRQEAILITESMIFRKLAHLSLCTRHCLAQQASAASGAPLFDPQEVAPFPFISFSSCQRIR